MADRAPARDIFLTFLLLGLTAFGGPISHLAYFRDALVVRRGWLDEAAYAELVALCQFLPGPTSSQAAFAIGLRRGGAMGGLAAWFGFSLPSVALMTALAYGVASLTGPLAAGTIAGLKVVAVAIVAQAVLGMARALTPDAPRLALAVIAALAVLLVPSGLAQVAVIALGAVAGLRLPLAATPPPTPVQHGVSRRAGAWALAIFLGLLILGPLARLAVDDHTIAVAEAFYRSGALVFGGGHVVLPLLHEAVVAPGWIDENTFLAGYAAAQAMPGPLFSFGAFLGAAFLQSPHGLAGAALAFVALSAPGLLAVTAALPFWSVFSARPAARAMLAGANAAVVGVLAAALYDPIWRSAVRTPADAAAAVAGFVLLAAFRTPPVAVVILGAVFGLARAGLT